MAGCVQVAGASETLSAASGGSDTLRTWLSVFSPQLTRCHQVTNPLWVAFFLPSRAVPPIGADDGSR